jgi:hypothetical protein
MRALFVAMLAASTLLIDIAPAPAADLGVKVHRTHRIRAVARPWCVIENLGTAVWTCAPTRAACHAYEVPGTSLYCVRDPIPGRPLALLR